MPRGENFRGRKVGGRRAGTPNKTTKALKEMILSALDNAGGEKYLVLQAKNNPSGFLQLLGKVLPSEIRAEHTGPNGGAIPMGNTELANRILFLLSNLEKRAKAAGGDGKSAGS